MIIETAKEIVDLLGRSNLSDGHKIASLEIASTLVIAQTISDASECPPANGSAGEEPQSFVAEARSCALSDSGSS